MKKCFIKKKGFTLVEVIIVLVIITIIATIFAPSFSGYIDKAHITAVISNGRMAYVAAQTLASEEYSFNWSGGPSESNAEDLADVPGSIITMTFTTPGRVDTTNTSPFRYKEGEIIVKCINGKWMLDTETGGGSGDEETDEDDDTKETEESGGGEETPVFPGTTSPILPSVWPTEASFQNDNDNITVQAGGIFQYTDGKYYIVTRTVSLTKGQALTGPGGDAFSWFSTQSPTGRIITDWTDTNSMMSDLNRGDIVEYNGSYYVYQDGGSWATHPSRSNQWYKIP